MTYSLYHISIYPDLNTGYIGITKNAKQRLSYYIRKPEKTNAHLKAAFQKYGSQVFQRIVLSKLNKELAELCEEMLRPVPNMGWNIAKGGGIPPNPKGKTRSVEYCENISKSKLGNKNPMFGRKMIFSEEHRAKLSIASKSKPKYKLIGVKRKLVECPNCNKIGGDAAMMRWHFDRCRNESV